MTELHQIWIEQCNAAEGIRADYGINKPLGYLLGEKLMNYIDAARKNADFRAELPDFVARVQQMFPSSEIAHYLRSVKRVGGPAHCLSDEQYDEMQAKGAFDQSPVFAAQDILNFEEMKRLLSML